ncbi:MAG: hypothetical protein QG611_769 [Bacteroidota bacterium]|nr:hypothetical protein [Bacteroidota bacterium]
MSFINKYRIIIAVILPVIILVLIRTFNPNHFQSDAGKWAEPSVLKLNTVSVEQAGNLTGDILIINLGKETSTYSGIMTKSIDLTPETILSRKNFKVIRNHEGPVILYSSQISISARIWMLLSQMGCKNIYILSRDTDNEALKYEFRPDTSVRPEF